MTVSGRAIGETCDGIRFPTRKGSNAKSDAWFKIRKMNHGMKRKRAISIGKKRGNISQKKTITTSFETPDQT